jgi:hypothetical protein
MRWLILSAMVMSLADPAGSGMIVEDDMSGTFCEKLKDAIDAADTSDQAAVLQHLYDTTCAGVTKPGGGGATTQGGAGSSGSSPPPKP